MYFGKKQGKTDLLNGKGNSDQRSNRESAFSIADNRREASVAGHVQSLADNRVSSAIGNTWQLAAVDLNAHEPVVQKQKNNTGLPDNLKQGMESLSGYSLDSVRVHYNSAKPAALQAHAYAQGNEIHLGSGQERHLPHELGHVVQQMEGRVRATTEVGGVGVNDDVGLESEASRLGDQAVGMDVNSKGMGRE